MISLDYLNQLKSIGSQYHDGDGEGAMQDMLEALLPALPPMVGVVVSEFLRNINDHPKITAEDIHDDRPDFPRS